MRADLAVWRLCRIFFNHPFGVECGNSQFEKEQFGWTRAEPSERKSELPAFSAIYEFAHWLAYWSKSRREDEHNEFFPRAAVPGHKLLPFVKHVPPLLVARPSSLNLYLGRSFDHDCCDTVTKFLDENRKVRFGKKSGTNGWKLGE